MYASAGKSLALRGPRRAHLGTRDRSSAIGFLLLFALAAAPDVRAQPSQSTRGGAVEAVATSAEPANRWFIASLVLQTATIVALAVEYRRRKRAEMEIRRHLAAARAQLHLTAHLERRAMMGEITSAIVHELNQPIEAILHNAEAAEMMLDSNALSMDELRQILSDIRRIDTRAGEIVQRLRTLLQRHEIESEPVDVNAFAKDTVALARLAADAHGVHLVLELTDGVGPIRGDRVHLQQVLLNLLLNGIDAMASTPREARRLFVRVEQADRQVRVSVTDAGHGISGDALERVFEPYYTTKNHGMGVGLSIARTIVEAHGGCITVRNNAGSGATFCFTLPAGGVVAVNQASPHAVPASSTITLQ